MRQAIDRMKQARLPRLDALHLLEIALLGLLAIQGARLVWAVVTPVGVFGDWRGREAMIPSAPARMALFSSFDAFYRSAPTGGPQTVTSLALTLYGIRLNEGSGLGSAILATPDGQQNSYAVGDEILPGVLLKAVAFDHVVISHGGADESLFIDQSQGAAPATPDSAAQPVAAPPPVESGTDAGTAQPAAASLLAPAALKSDIGFAPRSEGGRITGLMLSARGPAFQAAGFQPGDILTQVNGRAITSPADIAAIQGQIVPGARLSLMVERGATTIPIALTLQGS